MKLKSKLEAKTTAVYNLVIKSNDNGSPPLSDDLNLQINIKETNDYSPKFTVSGKTVTVAEDAAVGYTLYTPSASDLDGVNLMPALIF